MIDHFKNNRLRVDSLPYKSIPLTEQDVVGLFNQLAALSIFPGMQIFSTSTVHTYDGLVSYNLPGDDSSLIYRGSDDNPLGVSAYIVGEGRTFETRYLTIEFKSTLDKLIDELSGDTKKDMRNIDICVCWSSTQEEFRGYELDEIGDSNLETREFPGITHVLTRHSDEEKVAVVMLETIIRMMSTDRLKIVMS